MGLKTLKYLKHLVLFAKYSLIRTASFKVDFWLRFLVDFFYYLSSVIVIFTIYENVSSIRGWTREEYFLILSIFFLIDSYQMVFVSPNAWNVNYLINSGKLDYFLLKPVSSFFLVFFNTVEVSSILNFLITIPFSIFSIVQAKLDFISICLYFFAALLGGIIFTSIRVIVAMLNFFSESPYGFERVWIALRSFIEYPRHVFPPPVRFVLTFLIPVLMVASIPAEVVKTNSFCLLALLAVFCTGLVILTCFLWRVCLRQYASASS